MPRRSLEPLVGAGDVLVEGEQVIGQGPCWAAPLRPRVPLLVLRRRQFLLVLTDQRLLLFGRRRGRAPRPTDRVASERYEALRVEHVRRARPLLQVLLGTRNGTETVFEFRRGQRSLGETLVRRVDAGVRDRPPPGP